VNRSIDERTVVHFADNSERKLKAYVDNGEGLDRAGGFAIQVRSLLHLTYIYRLIRTPNRA
jgi:predicted house-cleaning NTP pyrophosphatase (Maf/HAM1 superfamily)